MEFIFARGSALLSRVIMWSQKFRFSHMAVRYSWPDDEWLVHSSFGGVQPDWFSHFEKKYPHRQHWRLTADVLSLADVALDEMVKEIGHRGYDYLGLIGMGLVKLAALFGWKIKNPLGDRRLFFCSEEICELVNRIGEKKKELNLRMEYDWDLKQIRDYFASRPDVFEMTRET